MDKTAQQLADALRALLAQADAPSLCSRCSAGMESGVDTERLSAAHAALAAFDEHEAGTGSEPAAAHTAEPWAVGRKVPRMIYAGADGQGDAIAACDGSVDDVPRAVEEANARRIVACVNYCTGIGTNALEVGAKNGGLRSLALFAATETTRAERLSPYARRVRELEANGMTTGDAQAVADAEGLED